MLGGLELGNRRAVETERAKRPTEKIMNPDRSAIGCRRDCKARGGVLEAKRPVSAEALGGRVRGPSGRDQRKQSCEA
jgi:hypothetical protein